MSYNIDERMRGLFVEFGPKVVMATWSRVLQEFREALKEIEPSKAPIVLTETVAPVPKKENTLVVPPSGLSDKELYQKKQQLHKEAVETKRKDQEAKGVNPLDLLTEENLKRWIQVEKKSYWVIAEEIGVQDTVISAKAKSLNILSDVALMIRKKKASLK
jgi:hypothetical protein